MAVLWMRLLAKAVSLQVKGQQSQQIQTQTFSKICSLHGLNPCISCVINVGKTFQIRKEVMEMPKVGAQGVVTALWRDALTPPCKSYRYNRLKLMICNGYMRDLNSNERYKTQISRHSCSTPFVVRCHFYRYSTSAPR